MAKWYEKPVETEQSRVQSFPPCFVCGERHDWRPCYFAQRRERKAKRAASQRGGEPTPVAEALPSDLRLIIEEKRKARKEKASG